MNIYCLKNIHTGEIVDILADTLADAITAACEFCGGLPEDYKERF